MTTRALERVDDWETRSYTGGYRGVHELADQGFSGVVRAGTATLCMLNGTAVGVLDGTIEDFADADGTAHVAPTPALPLLAVMQERSDEVRAKYYTEDTPLSKVDRTLEDGGFTGFVELSENVLSGDYYVVYHGGRSMSVAFVGERGRLLTEDEAFERADDEVGIYEVRPVEIDVIDVPEPDPEPTSSASGVGAGDAAAESGGEDTEATEDATPADPEVGEETDASSENAGDEASEGPTDPSTGESPPEEDTPDDEPHAESETASEDAETDASPGGDDASSTTPDETATGGADSGRSTTAGQETERSDRDAVTGRTGEPDRTTDARSGTGETEASEGSRRSTGRSSSPAESEPRASGRTDEPGRPTGSSSGHPGAEAATSSRSGATTARRRRDGPTGGAADLEIRTIPSLDPSRSWGTDEDGPQASTVPVPPVESETGTATRQRPADQRTDAESSEQSTTVEEQSTAADRTTSEPTSQRSTAGADDQRQQSTEPGESTETRPTPSGDERVRELQAAIDEREARIDDLEDRVETAESKRDELEAERDELEAARDDLREELSEVRSELASLEEERDALASQLDGLDVGTDGIERRMSRREAIEGTNLFVRYGSKSAPTLAAARESGASQSDVRENLSVEYHTQFEVDGTLVEGHPFEEFLRETMEHQFVTWVVTELLFEIRDTGHREALADLYDALPHIDRVELNGSVGVEFDEDGQTKRSQESFDVVFRDRMGNPLLVANMNDSRQAATENQMNSLVTAATRVGDTSDSLAGAMFVTSSFFEPAALETTADATGGGLLSRDKRESFVKLSRKRGYHLCLVEARDDQFHMAVPEL